MFAMVSDSECTNEELRAAMEKSANPTNQLSTSDIPDAQQTQNTESTGGSGGASQRPPTPDDIRKAWDIIKLSQKLKLPQQSQDEGGKPQGSKPFRQLEGDAHHAESRPSGLGNLSATLPWPPPPALGQEDLWLEDAAWNATKGAQAAAAVKTQPLLNIMSAVDQESAIASMEPDLQSLLEEYKVEREIMGILAECGFTDVLVFAKAGRDEAAFEKFISKNLKLDVEESMRHNAAAARLTLAWEAAVERKDVQKKEDAEARVGGLNKILTKTKHSTMKRAYEEAHAELENPDAPSPAYLEYRLEQIEDGELEAEPLDWVTSKAEAPKSRSKKGELQKGSLPSNPEELRTKFKLIGRAWEYMRLRNPSKPFMLHLSENTWTEHVDWLLGRLVYGSQVKDPGSATIIRPSWEVVLNYDLEVRTRAYKLVNRQGFTIRDALISARTCRETFARHFQGPMTVQAGITAARQAATAVAQQQGLKRTWNDAQAGGGAGQQQWTPPPPPHARGRGKGDKGDKGRGKGKDKAKGKEHQFTGWRSGGSNYSEHEKKYKCFAFQKQKCTTANCAYAHRCTVCDDTHPEKRCPRKPPGEGDAAGSART